MTLEVEEISDSGVIKLKFNRPVTLNPNFQVFVRRRLQTEELSDEQMNKVYQALKRAISVSFHQQASDQEPAVLLDYEVTSFKDW